MLVDRSVVEVFVQGGRAVPVARDYNGRVDEVAVHITNTNKVPPSPKDEGLDRSKSGVGGEGGVDSLPLEVRSLAVYSMGCGWV